ncbi:DUF2062 domain-containing protein [Natronorarus salvus]|uniref:DUF2062 domain-containing protein n=1 Tax=Natronorarus salvus TaxID=3117733 RepID=UPI002F26CDB2
MGAGRLAGYVEQVRATLRVAFSEDHPPHLIAVSFALGMFVTTLPSFGVGIPVLMWIGHRFAWANKLAFFAAVATLNPLMKGGVYVVSFLIGVQLLGPVPGTTSVDIGIDAGAKVLIRLLVGNVILAIGFAIVSYIVAYRIAHAVRQHRA